MTSWATALWLGLSLTACAAPESAIAEEAAPVRIVLAVSQPPRLRQKATIQLTVAWKGRTPQERALLVGAMLEVFLNLPPGFTYVDGPLAPLPPAEQPKGKDPTGPWSTYRWSGRLGEAAVSQETVVTLPVTVRATQPGENWVLTAAVQGAHGGRSWREHAVLFATVSKDGPGEFHATPKAPAAGTH